MTLGLLSLALGMPIDKGNERAFSGSISLDGDVLTVGGIQEKILDARKAVIATVFVPEENRKEAEELSTTTKNAIQIVYVANIREISKTH